VQQVLIPEALPSVPGFTLESEYRPAQKVGATFYDSFWNLLCGPACCAQSGSSAQGISNGERKPFTGASRKFSSSARSFATKVERLRVECGPERLWIRYRKCGCCFYVRHEPCDSLCGRYDPHGPVLCI
jgi:hypothetical protein